MMYFIVVQLETYSRSSIQSNHFLMVVLLSYFSIELPGIFLVVVLLFFVVVHLDVRHEIRLL